MGIRFNTNTWRAPLLLIDSWLPEMRQRTPSPRAVLPQVLQRFSRAGWLECDCEPSVPANDRVPSTNRAPTFANSQRACRVRILRAVDTSNSTRCKDARLVISGRISDVCAELDRLAALENQFCPERS